MPVPVSCNRDCIGGCPLVAHVEDGRVTRIAAASRSCVPSGNDSIRRFITDCHRLDPALTTASRHLREPMLVNKMDINDIPDPRYRRCFELTGVTERLSLYSRYASGLYQLSIYRTAKERSSVPAAEAKHFTALASLIMITGLKHEMMRASERAPSPEMGLPEIEVRLQALPGQLSERECQVCARALPGAIGQPGSEGPRGRCAEACQDRRGERRSRHHEEEAGRERRESRGQVASSFVDRRRSIGADRFGVWFAVGQWPLATGFIH